MGTYRQGLLQGSGIDPARVAELEAYGLDQLRAYTELIVLHFPKVGFRVWPAETTDVRASGEASGSGDGADATS